MSYKKIYTFMGVHGSGKSTLISEFIKKHQNIKFVSGDIADHRSEDLQNLSGLRREICFLSDTYIGLIIATQYAINDKIVLIDMPLEQVLPYSNYWIKDEKNKKIIYKMYENFKEMFNFQKENVELVYILFDVNENKISEIISRLKNRDVNRDPNFIREETDERYVKFIVNEFKKLKETLSKEETVIVLDALDTIENKISSLERLIFSQ